jgi:hypothetical protein
VTGAMRIVDAFCGAGGWSAGAIAGVQPAVHEGGVVYAEEPKYFSLTGSITELFLLSLLPPNFGPPWIASDSTACWLALVLGVLVLVLVLGRSPFSVYRYALHGTVQSPR